MQFRDRQHFEAYTLQNGITLHFHPMEVPFVQIRVLIPVGSVHSHEGNEGGALGIAHFLEHMCFERSALYPEKHAFERRLSACGGDWNATTSVFFTDFFMQVPAEDFDALLPGFISHVFDPLLLEEDIELQRGIVRNERQQRKYYPGDTELSRYLYSEWMQGRFFSKEQLFGDDAALASHTHERLKTFHRNYAAQQVHILVGGSFDAAAVRAACEAIETRPHTALTEVCDPAGWIKREFHTASFKDIDTPEYYWGGITATSSRDAWRYIVFICDYLTDSNTGMLNDWLRRENGWSYGVTSNMWYAKDRLSWLITMPVNDETVVRTIRAELHERVMAALADEEKVRAAAVRMQKESLFWLETLASRMNAAAEYLMEFGEIETDAMYFSWLKENAHPANMRAAYETYFAPNISGELLALPKD